MQCRNVNKYGSCKNARSCCFSREKYKIWAVDVNSVEDELGKFDILLIGPQIQYKLKTIKLVDDKVPVSIINPVSYGTCNGAEILSHAEKMFEDFRKEK